MDLEPFEIEPSNYNDENVLQTITTIPTDYDWAYIRSVMKIVSELIKLKYPLGCISFICSVITIRIFWLITSDKAQPTYVFLLGLSVIRSINCLYAIYEAIMGVRMERNIRRDLLFWYGSIMTHFFEPLDETAKTATVYLLVVASVERVQHYFGRRYFKNSFRNRRKCLIILFVTYLFAFAYNMPRFFELRISEHIHPYIPGGIFLGYRRVFPNWYYDFYTITMYNIVNWMLPFPFLVILSICNGIALFKTRASTSGGSHGVQQDDISQQKWLTVTVVISCFSYVLCTTPNHIGHWTMRNWGYGSFIPAEHASLSLVITELISLYNIMFSTMVYFVCLDDFRRKFFEMFSYRKNLCRKLAGRFRRRFLPGHDLFSVEYHHHGEMEIGNLI